MRSILLATLAAVAIPACVSDIAGGPGGVDNTQTPSCGNGVIDPGEACDDGNTNNGDGCSSSCTIENTATPRISITTDSASAKTDLNAPATITLTVTSEMGFTGTVTLAAAADGADWTAALDNSSLAITAGGTATAKLSVTAMGDTAMLTGNVKVTATYSGPQSDASVAMTFNPILDVKWGDNGAGLAVYDPNHLSAAPFKLKAGRSIKVINGSTVATFRVHTGNAIGGFQHQPDTSAPGGFYMGTTAAADIGKMDTFYTHMQGASPQFLNDTGVTTSQRPFITVVQ
jgi:cysteine-rich repeat protein